MEIPTHGYFDVTEHEYRTALIVVKNYEAMVKEKAKTLAITIKEAVTEYFKTNKLDGHSKVKGFDITPDKEGKNFEIEIYNPFVDEDYSGGNDTDIERIGQKFGVNLFFDSGMYGK